jgi:hypothetical protein
MAEGIWQFRAHSQTRLNKSGIWTVLDTRDESTNSILYNQFSGNLNGGAPQNLSYTASPSITTSHLAHRSLQRFLPQLTIRSFPTSIPIRGSSPGGSRYENDVIYIGSADRNNKWTVTHEVGHYIFFEETEESYTAYGLDYSLGGIIPCATPVSHNPQSREYSSAANLEGFASYWSAMIFNETLQFNCWTRFGGLNISCAGGDAGTPIRYMETQCSGGASLTGDGNETDWQRTYWDLTRGDTGGIVPTVTEVLTFVRSGTGWTRGNNFQALLVASNLASTPAYLESRWDAAVLANGSDN